MFTWYKSNISNAQFKDKGKQKRLGNGDDATSAATNNVTTVCTVILSKGELKSVRYIVHNVKLDLMLDLRAKVSLISCQTYDQYFSFLPLRQQHYKLCLTRQ